MVQAAKPRDLAPAEEIALIKKKLGHALIKEAPARYWLDLGQPLLHKVLGSEAKGLPYGRIFEISGFESSGKTAITLELAGYAQRDGASVAIWDLEHSWDPGWARMRGLDPERVYVFKPEIVRSGKDKELRFLTAEESAEEVELWIKRRHELRPSGRIFLAVDSIAAILTEEEANAGVDNQNMRTKVALAGLLNPLLRRWQNLAMNYNVMMVMTNQLRKAPGVVFGDPTYTPGGYPVRFYSAVRVRMYRKGPKLIKNGKPVGIRGVIRNWKNKAGEGAHEGGEAGFKLYFSGQAKYMSANEITEEKEKD